MCGPLCRGGDAQFWWQQSRGNAPRTHPSPAGKDSTAGRLTASPATDTQHFDQRSKAGKYALAKQRTAPQGRREAVLPSLKCLHALVPQVALVLTPACRQATQALSVQPPGKQAPPTPSTATSQMCFRTLQRPTPRSCPSLRAVWSGTHRGACPLGHSSASSGCWQGGKAALAGLLGRQEAVSAAVAQRRLHWRYHRQLAAAERLIQKIQLTA